MAFLIIGVFIAGILVGYKIGIGMTLRHLGKADRLSRQAAIKSVRHL